MHPISSKETICLEHPSNLSLRNLSLIVLWLSQSRHQCAIFHPLRFEGEEHLVLDLGVGVP